MKRFQAARRRDIHDSRRVLVEQEVPGSKSMGVGWPVRNCIVLEFTTTSHDVLLTLSYTPSHQFFFLVVY